MKINWKNVKWSCDFTIYFVLQQECQTWATQLRHMYGTTTQVRHERQRLKNLILITPQGKKEFLFLKEFLLYIFFCFRKFILNFFTKSRKKLRSSRPDVFCKKGVLRNFSKFTGKHLCQGLFFNKVAGLVFSCEFWEISNNTFFYRTPLVATSENYTMHEIGRAISREFRILRCSHANYTMANIWLIQHK